MARARLNSANTLVWTLEASADAPLSAQLQDLKTIFDYYSKDGSTPADDQFLMKLLTVQTGYLQDAAKRQERDMEILKKDLAALKKEITDLKDPPQKNLDKAKPNKSGLG